MIVIKDNQTEISGTTGELIAEFSRALYRVIECQSKATGEPFSKTAEQIMTIITKTVLKAEQEIGKGK